MHGWQGGPFTSWLEDGSINEKRSIFKVGLNIFFIIFGIQLYFVSNFF